MSKKPFSVGERLFYNLSNIRITFLPLSCSDDEQQINDVIVRMIQSGHGRISVFVPFQR